MRATFRSRRYLERPKKKGIGSDRFRFDGEDKPVDIRGNGL